MPFTAAQKTTVKADALANPDTLAAYNNGDLSQLAALYNADAAPDYWSWRTVVTRADIYNSVSPDSTTWNWSTYKNQGVTEQNAWVQMFMGDETNFGKKNLRDGVAAIFTGSAQANAQRDHVLAMGRRKSSRIEKLLAVATTGGSGTRGSTANPDTLTVEGPVPYQDYIGINNW